MFESCVNPEGYKAITEMIMSQNGFESCVNPEGYKAGKARERKVTAFESCVNPEGYKAGILIVTRSPLFESCVNPEGYKAASPKRLFLLRFESCVNPEGYKEKIGRAAGMIRRRAAASGFAAGRGRPRGHRAKARCRHGRGNAIMGESPPQPSAVARAVMNGPAPSWA